MTTHLMLYYMSVPVKIKCVVLYCILAKELLGVFITFIDNSNYYYYYYYAKLPSFRL